MVYGHSGGYSAGPAASYAMSLASPVDYGHGADAYARAGKYGQGPVQDMSAYMAINEYGIGSPYGAADMHASIVVESFLAPNRPVTPMVTKLGDVKKVVEQTYEELTGQAFPHDDIRIQILPENEFSAMHRSISGHTSSGVMGFSLNRYGFGISEICVRQDNLDSVLLTLGHEIGHVLSPTLPNAQDEEAKAHAFSLAWMETIRDNNIGGLLPNIRLNPAKNGLHDVAFEFVVHLLNTGASAHDIFKTLSTGLTSIIAEAS